MFTGIVEAVGSVAEVKPMAGGFRVRIATALAGETQPGDSVSVSGVCLTALAASGGEVHADIGPETVRVTTLGALERGQRVNLERPLRADGRLGGHFVLGHVDGVGTVAETRPDGDSLWLTIAYPPALAALFIRKGSMTVDGVSLTIAGLDDRHCDVMIVPYTRAHTTLGALQAGARVNLECDVLGKYVLRSIEVAEAADARRR